MKKNFLTLLIVMGITNFGIAQKMIKSQESTPKIAVKVNLFIFLASSVGPSVEVKVANKLSLNLSGAYSYGVGTVGVQSVISNSSGLTVESSFGRFTGFALTPELRFYPSKKRAALNGFYIGPFFRYSKGGSGTTLILNNKTYDGDINFRSIGGGLMLGYQWILGEHFVLDWGFFGPRLGRYKMDLRAGPIAQGDRVNFINDVNEVLSGFNLGDNNTFIPTNQIDRFFDSRGYFGSNSIPLGVFPAYRTTLSIGFSF